jgi:hypothetical protein
VTNGLARLRRVSSLSQVRQSKGVGMVLHTCTPICLDRSWTALKTEAASCFETLLTTSHHRRLESQNISVFRNSACPSVCLSAPTNSLFIVCVSIYTSVRPVTNPRLPSHINSSSCCPLCSVLYVRNFKPNAGMHERVILSPLSSALLRGVMWFETDVSGLSLGPVFKGQAVWSLKMGLLGISETSV